MDWPVGRKGRALAGMYVVAFVAMVAGLVWALYNQATGRTGTQVVVGGCVFVTGQLVITFLAFGLRTRAPLRQGKGYPDGYQVLWQRLTLGRELRPAGRLLRGM
jgi:hypothetical protein